MIKVKGNPRLSQARFQQKQLQEKEQKLLQLYDQQQQRAYQVVQRGSASSNGSNYGSSVSQHSVTKTSTSSHTTSTSQGGKVSGPSRGNTTRSRDAASCHAFLNGVMGGARFDAGNHGRSPSRFASRVPLASTSPAHVVQSLHASTFRFVRRRLTTLW